MRKNLIELLNIANIEYKKKFGWDKTITRDYFRKHLAKSKYIEQDITKEFGSFKNFMSEIKYSRKSIDIKKTCKNPHRKKYIITSYVTGADINKECLESIKRFCKKEKAKLVLLVESGVNIKDYMPDKEYENIKDCICTEYVFNKNLTAKDFYINPQQVNPLTGVNRYGNKNFSLIVGSPKQFMAVVPSRKDILPHLIYSTGTICKVNYRQTRAGLLSEQDQKLGGLIIETKNDTIFFVRNFEFDENFGFYDIDKYYGSYFNKKSKKHIVWGDLHAGQEDRVAVDAAIEMSKKMDSIVIHDFFNGRSTMRHDRNDMIKRLSRKNHEKTLKSELDYAGRILNDISKKFKNKKIYIVCSNHDRFLNDYLSRREFINDEENIVLSCELFVEFYKGKNPIEYYMRKNFKIDNVFFLDLEESLLLNGIQCGYHSDMGHSGGRGGIKNLDSVYPYSVIAHSHSPGIFRNTFQAGCLCELDQYYAKGQGSKWCHGNAIIHENCTRQMVLIINGEYKI